MNQRKYIIKVLLLVLTFSMIFSFFNTASAPPEEDISGLDEPQTTQDDTDVVSDESQTTPQDNTSAIDESQTAAEDDNITPSDIIIAQAEPGRHGEITELTPVGAPYNELGPIQFRCTTTNTGTTTICKRYLRHS